MIGIDCASNPCTNLSENRHRAWGISSRYTRMPLTLSMVALAAPKIILCDPWLFQNERVENNTIATARMPTNLTSHIAKKRPNKSSTLFWSKSSQLERRAIRWRKGFWTSMDIHGHPWIALDIHRYPLISKNILVCPLVCMDIPGYPQTSMDNHHVCPWIALNIHGYLWSIFHMHLVHVVHAPCSRCMCTTKLALG